MPDEQFPGTRRHHDVFISYAQEDKPVADAVCARLESRNIRCWIAPRDIPPGKNFPEAIIEGIEEGKVVVVIFSSSANKSPHVTRELTNAVNKGRIIIPFRIEDVSPSKSMEYLISVPHWLDAVTPPLEKHIDVLVGTVESIIHPELNPAASRQTLQTPGRVPVPAEPATSSRPEPAVKTTPMSRTGLLAVTGIVLAAIVLLVIGLQAGLLIPAGTPGNGSGVRPALPAPVDYRASDAVVNTVVLTTLPTQTLAPDTGLYIDVNKDDSNAMVTVQFNGGPGMGLVRDNRIILTRSDGTSTEGKLDFNTRLSEARLQGTRGTDRIQVIVTLSSGAEKTIVDSLLPYRTYH